jgi:hypothetical protein
MSERRPCINCGRTIDAVAKSCPYCNWDQTTPAAPRAEGAPPLLPAYTPPVENFWRGKILGAIGGVALLVIAFVVGAFLHGGEPEVKGPLTSTAAPTPAPQSSTHAPSSSQSSHIELVPDAGGGTVPVNETPITTAPAATASDGSMSNPYARDDATALAQSDYAQLAQRAKAEAKRAPGLVDPRTIGGSAAGAPGTTAARPPRPAGTFDVPMASSTPPIRRVMRTEPVAVYQPVPAIRVYRDAKARLLLTVGEDGRVKDIDIAEGLPGDTARLISAVQSWRFRPATENGVPVASRFAVDITFHAND